MPPKLKEKWWFYVDEINEDRADLCRLEKLSRMSFIYKGMTQIPMGGKEDNRRNENKVKQFSILWFLVQSQTYRKGSQQIPITAH